MANYSKKNYPISNEIIEARGFAGDAPKVYSGKDAKATAVDLRVGVTSTNYDRDGEEIERTTWYKLNIFGYKADAVMDNVDKGTGVWFRGKMLPTEYTNRDGELVEDVIVNVDEISLAMFPNRGNDEDDKPRRKSRRSSGASRRNTRNEDVEDDVEDDDLGDDFEEDAAPRRRSGRGRASGGTRSRRRRSATVESDDDVDDYLDNDVM